MSVRSDSLSSKNFAQFQGVFMKKFGFTMTATHYVAHMVSMFIGNKKSVFNLFSEG